MSWTGITPRWGKSNGVLAGLVTGYSVDDVCLLYFQEVRAMKRSEYWYIGTDLDGRYCDGCGEYIHPGDDLYTDYTRVQAYCEYCAGRVDNNGEKI